MNKRHAAEAVFALHILFVVLALFGAFGVLVTPWWLLAHLPIVAWSAWVNLANRECPLTPLEHALRGGGGDAVREMAQTVPSAPSPAEKPAAGSGLDDGFIVHYVGRHLRPGATPQQIEHLVGMFIIGWNVLVYAFVGGWLRG